MMKVSRTNGVKTMAKYTIELENVIKMGFNIFDDSWCTFVPAHKKELCDKIIRHYRFNEIGSETPERFIHYLNEQLALEMPVWNKLYESELWELYPLYNHIMSSEGNSETSNLNHDLHSGRVDSSALREFGESMYNDKWIKFDETQHHIKGEAGHLDGLHNEDETINVVGTKNYTKTQDNELNETADRTIKETTESKEVVDDDTTGNTKGTDNTTTSGFKWDSDTPQGEITPQGFQIDTHFLTNYEHHSDTSNRTYNEDRTGTDDRTTDYNKTVDTTDNLVRKVTEDNVETYDEKTTQNTDRHKTNKDVEDTTLNVDETTTTDNTTHDNTTEWKENNERNTSGQINADSRETKGNEKSKRYDNAQGTVGVSRVDLLQRYRESLINIDLLIIKSLAVNFMGVF